MKFENTNVYNFENAIRGMRNPLESWKKSDSKITDKFELGENDKNLAQRLIAGGSEHRKFLRQIFVCVDITVPLYWWKEFDTYKVGTVANSTSTMHKLATTPITRDCFEMDDYNADLLVYPREPYDFDQYMDEVADDMIDHCENLRKWYLETKDVRYWKELIRWLPESWLQTRTVTLNYENLFSIVHQRKGHKLTEWHSFLNWVYSLPYAHEFLDVESELTRDATKMRNMMKEIKELGENPTWEDIDTIVERYID